MRKRIILVLWLAGIIFPMAVLGRVSPPFRNAFNTIFSPNWVHVVMHALLFAGLVVFLLAAFKLKPGWRAAGFALLAIVIVGVLQEGMQAISQGYFLLKGSVFDLGVDLIGGIGGYGFTRFAQVAKRQF